MRAFVLALVMVAAAAPAAQAAVAQTLTRSLSGYAGTAAMGSDQAGMTAVAYETRRGIEVRVARGDAPFGPAVLAASRARGGNVDGELKVAVGGGRVLVAWTRGDRSFAADPESRDDGCCNRVHAVVVGADGRPGKPRRLSRAGVDREVGPLGVTATTAAVTWQPPYETAWSLRVHRHGRWLAARRVLTGAMGEVGTVGGRLTVVGAVQAGRWIRVVRRAISPEGRLSRAVRIVRFRGRVYEADLRLDGVGRATGIVDMDGDRDTERLIARGRVRRPGLRGGETPRLAHARTGAAAVAAVGGFSRRTARVRIRSAAGRGFGRWRRIRIVRKGHVFDFDVHVATRADGVTSVLSTPGPSRHRLLMRVVTPAGLAGGLRRLRTYRREAEVLGTAYDGDGRLMVLVVIAQRLELVRP